MQIIRGQLSAMYIQHEAIEAQKAMVNSPNNTVVYIPVGPMGVPITGTFPTVPVAAEAAARWGADSTRSLLGASVSYAMGDRAIASEAKERSGRCSRG